MHFVQSTEKDSAMADGNFKLPGLTCFAQKTSDVILHKEQRRERKLRTDEKEACLDSLILKESVWKNKPAKSAQ